MEHKEWYSLTRIDKYDVAYKIIFGERGNGKTFSVTRKVLEKYQETGKRFAYLRRFKDQITRKGARKLFDDQQDWSLDNLHSNILYSTDSGFYILDEKDERHTVGYTMAIEGGTTQKGIPWNDVSTIFFDEFLEYGRPMEDEIPKFMNVISTITRHRDDVEIYLVANTVTKLSPYFTLFGIDLKKMRQGQITYFKHEMGVTGAAEWTSSINIIDGVRQKSKYLGFDNNPTANMILFGEWEYSAMNTTGVDGITWKDKRLLFPVYVTGNGDVYELTLYITGEPVCFVRKLNTQMGVVRKEIKYNLSYDDSVHLVNKNGTVPTYGKLNKLIPENILEMWETIKLCIEAKRFVSNNIESGSDFMKIYEYVK